MLRFRKILLSNSLYFIILSLVLILGFFRLTRPLKEANLEKTFTVTKIKLDGNYLELLLENEAQVLAQKYFKTEAEKNEFKINLGDQVKIKGSPKEIRNSGLPSSFDYQKYLKTQKISKVIKLEELELIESNKNILYQFKQDIIDYINGRKNATYLQIFILADSSTLEKDINLAYQEIAINHLLSISGTHVSFIAMIFLKVFKVFKIDELKSYLWITICLLALGFIASFPPAFLGSAVFFLYLSLNKIFYFNVKRINLFILAFSTLLLLNPSFIFHLGFQYHYLISFFLILSSDILNKHQNYFVSLFVTSLIAFLASLPLSLKINSYINPLSVLYNLVYVPYVVSCLFPLLIINLFLPFTDNLVSFLCFILEHLSSFLASFSTYLIFKKINNFFYLFYYLILLLSLKRKKLIYLFLIILTFHYSLSFRRDDYIMFLDQTTPNMIQGISGIYERNPLISKGILPFLNFKWFRKGSFFMPGFKESKKLATIIQ